MFTGREGEAPAEPVGPGPTGAEPSRPAHGPGRNEVREQHREIPGMFTGGDLTRTGTVGRGDPAGTPYPGLDRQGTITTISRRRVRSVLPGRGCNGKVRD